MVSARLAIGVGGNVGSETAIVARFSAVRSALEEIFECSFASSPVYRSAPVGPMAEQPAFLNAVLLSSCEVRLQPIVLMAALLDMELALGRDRGRGVPQGPRKIDIDVLFASELDLAIEGPVSLCLPHPALSSRRFVLQPLADLLGDEFIPPGQRQSLAALLPVVADQALEVTDHVVG
jgi:2-amino-4-hydroxy-6-hydroxymethyldihydropteridine diphosphokinase